MGGATSPRRLFVAAAILACGGCAVVETDLRSIPTFGPEIPTAYPCPKGAGVQSEPASGARLCFSIRAVKVEIEAHNAQPAALAFGPIPVVPFFPRRRPDTKPLTIELAFQPDRPYSFSPWEMTVETEQGEVVRVSAVDGKSRAEEGARVLAAHDWRRFSLTFEKHLPLEQRYSLTVLLKGADGSEVRVPIRFKKSKVSYFGSVP